MNIKNNKEALWIGLFGLSIIAVTLLQGCGSTPASFSGPANLPPTGPSDDGLVVRGVAAFTVSVTQENPATSFIRFLIGEEQAYAVTTVGTVIGYNLAPNVTFTVTTSTLVSGSYSGLFLNLGSFNITALKDTDTQVCGVNGNAQCNNAYLSVYTTGSLPGFINTTNNYSVPMYTTGLNPTVPMVLNSPGTTINQVLNMPVTKYVVNLIDFTGSTSYSVKADFTDGGWGTYSADYVLQYAQSL